MRKIILFIHSTFNGVVTGDPREDKTNYMVWTTDAAMGSEYLLNRFDTADTILLGRGTYEDLSRKWPYIKEWPINVSDVGSRLGEKINNAHKLVVTGNHPLDELKWGVFEAPKQLTGSNIEEQIKDLKQGNGGDIIIFGSPTLVRSLANANLIDEYQVLVHPVVVNVGEHLFDNLKERKDFHLVDVKILTDGSLLVTYEPAKA
ncbi:dihydrofolate reductase family protein [Paenibacillus sp. p3-SID867]|uniref:dihydrofolate reductase family protein n=1 Tax=Paenibacillus sp. p3-SID867 TaxID=2916363 RepID=UPI0021A814BC|nr:dihydrofolate reductase family protein [Paenibacillus sp. p3-SID867]MCT1403164.1 dihydrofolate reductase family protein [Paenibacillus sp. p3-SID867]